MTRVNYRLLLAKYINIVGSEEGVTFIPDALADAAHYGLSEQEWNALQDCDSYSETLGLPVTSRFNQEAAELYRKAHPETTDKRDKQ